MITRTVRNKLIAFVALTVVSIGMLTGQYMRVTERLGIGVYEVTMEMPHSGGLYPSAQVSYRGVRVGRVTRLTAAVGGVTATLRLDDEVSVPADVDAEIRSMSAVGEQYVDLVPHAGGQNDLLRNGSVIAASSVSLPTPTGTTLRAVEQLVDSLPQDDLRATIDEVGTAFGDGDDLGRLIEASSAFQEEATANLPATVDLLSDLRTVLETQASTTPQVRASLADLRAVSDRVVAADPLLRSLVADGPAVLDDIDKLSTNLQGSLPGMLADSWTTTNVLSTYREGIEHLFTVFPAVVSAGQSVFDYSGDELKVRLGFKTNVNTPRLCTEGYPGAGQQRQPHDLGPAPAAKGGYCKVASDDDRVVRGARNVPCPNSSARGATPRDCDVALPRMRAAGAAPPVERIVFMDTTSGEAVTATGERLDGRSLAVPLPTADNPVAGLLRGSGQ